MKNTHRNFPDSLLQQYNFDTNTIDAPAEASEEATDTDKPKGEADSKDAKPSDQLEEKCDKSATDSSPTEAEEDSEKEREEPPVRTSSKTRKKHIIQEEDENEPEEEPLILVLSRKGEEKIATPPASEDEVEQVDIELEAALTKVTRTPTEAKQLLDIIAAITVEGHAADAPTPTPPQQTPSKLVRASPRGSNKRKRSTSGDTATTALTEPKRTRSVSTKQAAPAATPPTNPLKKKKKTLPATSPQASLKDKLRSASKKH